MSIKFISYVLPPIQLNDINIPPERQCKATLKYTVIYFPFLWERS